MSEYKQQLIGGMDAAYAVAKQARGRGFDPSLEPEILPTYDIAERVEGLVGPKGIAEKIRALGVDKSREVLALEIAKQIVETQGGEAQAVIEQAVRTGVAILTEGVLVAPTEGIAGIKIKSNPDGSNYLSMYFAGPIRSAGGTVAALSVLLGDYARRKKGIADYRPTDAEIERYVEEVGLYDVRAARLQYKPGDDEIRTIIRNCPVCIDGDPTEEFEVSVYRDLPRVETNRIRGGIALVTCEGIAQKASKVLKYSKRIGIDWSWLESLVKVAKKEGRTEIKPDERYLDDIVAGRPIFAYPSERGGFRLRYGRARTSGIAAKCIHPAAMVALDSFPAIGTQLKIERPGKGCVITPCDSIEGPFVKLNDGSVLQLRSAEEAEAHKQEIAEILTLGDILVTYGDFLKSNHPLIPGGYCVEWWLKELERASGQEADAVRKRANDVSAEEAFNIAAKHGVPLHPRFTYLWHDVSAAELKQLAEWLAAGRLSYEWFRMKELRLQPAPAKRVLEMLCVPHAVEAASIVVPQQHAFALLRSLGMLDGKGISLRRFNEVFDEKKSALEIVNALAGVAVRAKAPTYIGGRMGRPEKARERKMAPAPHVLFPIGWAGGKVRSITRAYALAKERERFEGKGIEVEVARMQCPSCGEITALSKCAKCGARTQMRFVCPKCGRAGDAQICAKCGVECASYESRSINLAQMLDAALKRCGPLPEMKGVRGMTSKCKIPEPLEKGVLRARHGVFVFKDGTVRFDATDVPLTHFKPCEVSVSVERLRALGYTHDCDGAELRSDGQLLELKPQDILLSERGAEYLLHAANFVDDLLVALYELPPFYAAKSREDLLGHMIIGLAPHTSVGVLGRVIGFTEAHVGYAHPYFHTAKRRNADGDEDSVMLLLDALLNFSKAFLPKARGGTMDAPLVLTTVINPKEVDDEVHAMEVCSDYPLEFYEAGVNLLNPADVKIETVSGRLGTPEESRGLRFTHASSSLDAPLETRYVTLKTMKEKVEAQLSLAKRIRAVHVQDAAERMILSHFLPDLYGNLRSFSKQVFRCVDCSAKHRRVPLAGKCSRCGGKLVLTISKGGIEKYLKISQGICEEYSLPAYLKQRLMLLEKDIASIFEDEQSRQFSLDKFM